jgi:endonuclease YncB( thermonuclease family)
MKKITQSHRIPQQLAAGRVRVSITLATKLAMTLVMTACGGGGDSGSITSTATTLCGYQLGTQRLEGTVSGVHDGDTITVAGTTVRLDSIDAPELAQNYGSQSQVNLSALVLGKAVKIAYAKTDRYGRVVGSVFTSGCKYINLEQVSTGSAWYYRAYQCEISAVARNQFDQAETAAKSARKGLWSEAAPVAPWVYRNGSSPDIPLCSSDAPST